MFVITDELKEFLEFNREAIDLFVKNPVESTVTLLAFIFIFIGIFISVGILGMIV